LDLVSLIEKPLLEAHKINQTLGKNMIMGWAKGGATIVYPPEAGFRTGSTGARVLIFEVHIDNPSGVIGKTITTGVRVHYANTLRAHDAATLVLVGLHSNRPKLPEHWTKMMFNLDDEN
jgi:hypothetical protein